MNSNLDQKKVSVIEDALKMKEEGRRLSFIIAKFPDYESEIREIFGTVVFIKENKDKVKAPINILKTILSKIPESPPARPGTVFKKESTREINRQPAFAEDDEDISYGDSLIINEDNKIFDKWKVIIPVIILAVVMGVLLLRSDSKTNNEIINERSETSQTSSETKPALESTEVGTSTEEGHN